MKRNALRRLKWRGSERSLSALWMSRRLHFIHSSPQHVWSNLCALHWNFSFSNHLQDRLDNTWSEVFRGEKEPLDKDETLALSCRATEGPVKNLTIEQERTEMQCFSSVKLVNKIVVGCYGATVIYTILWISKMKIGLWDRGKEMCMISEGFQRYIVHIRNHEEHNDTRCHHDWKASA